jgi:hypothetical protein
MLTADRAEASGYTSAASARIGEADCVFHYERWSANLRIRSSTSGRLVRRFVFQAFSSLRCDVSPRRAAQRIRLSTGAIPLSG